jgi:hypothetical protein
MQSPPPAMTDSRRIGIEQAREHIRKRGPQRLPCSRSEPVKLTELRHTRPLPLRPRGRDIARCGRAVSLQHSHVLATATKQKRDRKTRHASATDDHAHRTTVTARTRVVTAARAQIALIGSIIATSPRVQNDTPLSANADSKTLEPAA